MQNTARRADIRGRTDFAAHLVEAYRARCHLRVQPYLRPIARLLREVYRRVDSKEQRPAEREQWWLDRAEEWLQFALQQLTAVKDHIDKQGGPASVRTL